MARNSNHEPRSGLSDELRHSLLTEADLPQVIPSPFPHIVVDNALPAPVHAELCRTMPSDDYLAGPRYKGPNRYHRRSAAELLDEKGASLSHAWRRFIEQSLGLEFYRICLSVFNKHLESENNRVKQMTGTSLEGIHPAMRHDPAAQEAAAWLECQISHVTPADEPGIPLGPHVDREVALWAGLYYLRGVGPGAGGDLMLYRFRDDRYREYWKDQMIPPSLVEPVKTIAARENRLVMFLHSPDAVHGVTPRQPGSGARQSVNLVCEFPFKIWSIEAMRHNLDRFPGETD